jgi:hypothetical protein
MAKKFDKFEDFVQWVVDRYYKVMYGVEAKKIKKIEILSARGEHWVRVTYEDGSFDELALELSPEEV